VYTTREGYEQDLLDELALARRAEGARVIAPALVASPKEYVDCAFARQAMPAKIIVKAPRALELDRAVTQALYELMGDQREKKWALHVWVPDSDEANKHARVADVLERTLPTLADAIDLRWAERRLDAARAARDAGGLLAQVCVLGPTRALVSATPAVEAHSLHPGGRARMRVDPEAPSRAAMKLEEALDWFGAAPSRGDQCVDLGAAPGGWTHVLLARGARVLAVDPGSMAPALAKHKSLEHVRGSAFDVEPERPVDWLFCDMVWRPLEVAALLAKWARRGWASMLVANIKLPMRQKAAFVQRILTILREGGWHRVRARQLYHDREEVTVCAHRK
jgi:23S rRNA (cytidine2498-2'-O)-methyltransferase